MHDKIKEHKCDKCEKTFVTGSELRSHMDIHDRPIIECTECEFKCIFQTDLEQHMYKDHQIKTRACTRCDKWFDMTNHLNRHLWQVHSIGNGVTYKCDFDQCSYETRSKCIFYSHKWFTHGIPTHPGHRMYKCTECIHSSKSNAHHKSHLSYVHDIGKHKCVFCHNNRNSQISYTDQNKITSKICRDCYKKVTGKESRAEVQVSDFLDEMPTLSQFLVGSDDSFKSMGGSSLKRPDKLYVSARFVLWIEVDEHQHLWNSESYKCEEKRISDGYDEFNGQHMVVIRFNPDSYTPPEGIQRLKRRERLNKLKQLINDVLCNPPTSLIFMYYLFYSNDNPLLSQSIPHKLVF